MKEEQLLKQIEAALKTASELAAAGANVNDLVRDLRSARDRTASRLRLVKAEADRAKAEAKAKADAEAAALAAKPAEAPAK